MSSLHRGFQGAEGAADAAQLVHWLELADAAVPIQAVKRRMLALGPVRQGDRVLDVGCGIGLEAARLVRVVRPGGQVVAFDFDAEVAVAPR